MLCSCSSFGTSANFSIIQTLTVKTCITIKGEALSKALLKRFKSTIYLNIVNIQSSLSFFQLTPCNNRGQLMLTSDVTHVTLHKLENNKCFGKVFLFGFSYVKKISIVIERISKGSLEKIQVHPWSSSSHDGRDPHESHGGRPVYYESVLLVSYKSLHWTKI